MSRRRQIKKWKALFALWSWAMEMHEIAYSRAEMRSPDGDAYWPNGGAPTKRILRLADSDQDISCHLDKLRAKNWRRCYFCGKKSNLTWRTMMCEESACWEAYMKALGPN